MTAKEMFGKADYNCYEDDGFTEYIKAECVPNRLNTEYIKFKKISFDRWTREVSIHSYRKNALCTETLENASPMKINSLDMKELQAIYKQSEEYGWLDE